MGSWSTTISCEPWAEVKCCKTEGCTYPSADNFNPDANWDDESCITCVNSGLCTFFESGYCRGPSFVPPDKNCPCIGNQGRCCDEYCTTAGDCGSFSDGGWVSPNGITYADCYGNIGGLPTPP